MPLSGKHVDFTRVISMITETGTHLDGSVDLTKAVTVTTIRGKERRRTERQSDQGDQDRTRRSR